MRRALSAKDEARAGARSDTESPASDTVEAAPVRRTVGLSGLAVAPSAAAGPVANGPVGPAADLGALRRQAAQHGGPTIRRMTVGGAPAATSVSGATHTKHVMAVAGQAADATAGYGSRTFVTDDATLIGAVNADATDFAAGPARSARVDVNAMVPIYQYDKTNAPPAGLAAGQPVNRTINGVATNCEIGAVKTGAGDISITHFKRA
ncbi:MAG TPA: hypothetical protein VF557_00940 [Jatrophihabitans sp.]|jgi:hypothetical protein|uniref:hypothetical protein n=1 Tax=Jatrophihabitans sp. TaxID=1932789 RepID=UPI002EE8E306